MISAVVGKNTFGPWLRATRLSTEDPSTGAPYTQERIGELMNISASKVAGWERGAIVSISPEDARLLARLLHTSEQEILEAIGYEVGPDSLTPDEREMLAAYRRLRASPILQETALRVMQAMPATNARAPRRSRKPMSA